jgi:hypothetical protein
MLTFAFGFGKAEASLAEIKDAVIAKATQGGFLSPIISFLKDMSLEWGDAPTAMAFVRDGKPVIVLGRVFFTLHVRNKSEAADVVLHEIMHHVFLHLARSEHYTKLGYSFHLQNLAMDAIINAYLARFNCAGFMERFYEDVGEYAFLRPRSEKFGVELNFVLFKKVRPLKAIDEEKYEIFRQFYFRLTQLQITLEDALKFFAKYFPEAKESKPLLGNHNKSNKPSSKQGNGGGSGNGAGKSEGASQQQPEKSQSQPQPADSQPQSSSPQQASGDGQESKADKGDGSGGEPGGKPSGEPGAAGEGGGSGNDSSTANQAPAPSSSEAGKGGSESQPQPKAEKPEPDAAKPEAKPESNKPDDALINPLQIAEVFKTMAEQAASKQARNNFAKVIKKILENSDKPGLNRDDWQLSRRVPAKLNRRDTISVERGKDLFTRNQHVQKEVWLLPDVSASMTRYLPFVVGLIKTLKRRDVQVRIACWSDRVREVPVEEMFKNQLPTGLGFGTSGEALAKFMNKEGIKEAVIITDNEAGIIRTPIKGFVHLCLVENSAMTGSFMNAQAVPRIATYQLKLRADD